MNKINLRRLEQSSFRITIHECPLNEQMIKRFYLSFYKRLNLLFKSVHQLFDRYRY